METVAVRRRKIAVKAVGGTIAEAIGFLSGVDRRVRQPVQKVLRGAEHAAPGNIRNPFRIRHDHA